MNKKSVIIAAMNQETKFTHFGFEKVPVQQKTQRVSAVFQSVASRYDLMNDVMSFGLHRFWKNYAISQCMLHKDQQVLDIAGGTGDLTARISKAIGNEGKVVLADINAAMLRVGKDKLLNNGLFRNICYVCADAENLPFADNIFDRVIIGFGLRNVTQQKTALESMYRVLKPGGFLSILEFSKPILPLLQTIYAKYSFRIIPWLGKVVAQDEESYRYLVESIRMHPDQEALLKIMSQAGFEDCRFQNLTQGIVALHQGYKY